MHLETTGTAVEVKAGKVPHLDVTRCTGCGRCVAACSERLVTLETRGYRKNAVISDNGTCPACGRCVAECPVQALILDDY